VFLEAIRFAGWTQYRVTISSHNTNILSHAFEIEIGRTDTYLEDEKH